MSKCRKRIPDLTFCALLEMLLARRVSKPYSFANAMHFFLDTNVNGGPIHMKTATLLPCLAMILAGNLLHAQILPNADRAKERYQQRLVAADKIKTDGIAKLTLNYETEVKSARDECKRTFESLIRTAALRNQTEDARALSLQMETFMNAGGVGLSGQNATGQTGTDFKQLIGMWESADSQSGYSRSFEFKLPRTVFYTHTYSLTGGGKGSSTDEWKATSKVDKPDKITITRKESRTYSYSHYKEWYEIKVPFGLDSLEITRFTESSGRNSNQTFRLKRKK